MKLYVAMVTLVGVIMGVASFPNLAEDIEIARKVAERYLAKQENARASGMKEVGHGLRSAKTPTKRTKQLLAQQEREEIEFKTLLQLALDDSEVRTLRNLEASGVDVFRRVKVDPMCTEEADCSNTENRNFVDETEYRTMDGTCNNLAHGNYGKAGKQQLRDIPNAYDNGRWNPRNNSISGSRRNPVPLPTPRAISEAVHRTSTSVEDSPHHTLALFQWGQFLDHDIVATPEGNLQSGWECCKNDSKSFCMTHYGGATDSTFEPFHCFEAVRSFTVKDCEESDIQQQINELTAYIDASNVYGNSKEESDELRTFVSGFLKMSTGNFLPYADNPSDVACDVTKLVNESCFQAGDSRANVQPGLASLHTVFARFHNKIASQLAIDNNAASDEWLFQETRKIVGAVMQRITYNEFLPALLDATKLSDYGVSSTYSYDGSIDPSISQSFTIAFRFHNMIPSLFNMSRVDSNGDVEEVVTKDMSDTWKDPSYLYDHGYSGVDEITLGQIFNACPHSKGIMADAVRNKLFGDVDLAALNILRAREWGTNSYTEFRAQVCNFSNVTTFDGLTDHSEEARDALASVYTHPQDIDLWTGIVTEIPFGNSMAGPTQTCLVARQFANLKHGDRFWYESALTEDQVDVINNLTYAGVLCDVTNISQTREHVFSRSSTQVSCESVDRLNVKDWNKDKTI